MKLKVTGAEEFYDYIPNVGTYLQFTYASGTGYTGAVFQYDKEYIIPTQDAEDNDSSQFQFPTFHIWTPDKGFTWNKPITIELLPTTATPNFQVDGLTGEAVMTKGVIKTGISNKITKVAISRNTEHTCNLNKLMGNWLVFVLQNYKHDPASDNYYTINIVLQFDYNDISSYYGRQLLLFFDTSEITRKISDSVSVIQPTNSSQVKTKLKISGGLKNSPAGVSNVYFKLDGDYNWAQSVTLRGNTHVELALTPTFLADSNTGVISANNRTPTFRILNSAQFSIGTIDTEGTQGIIANE